MHLRISSNQCLHALPGDAGTSVEMQLCGVAPWTGFTVSRTFNCIESYLIEPPTSLTAGCYLTCWQRKLAAWRRVNHYEFTSSGAAINMFGSFAALGIFGR